MLYLAGSIILTSWLTLSFKVLERLRINSFQAIVFNYITCVITGSLVNGSLPVTYATLRMPWFPWAIFMGITFISLYTLVGVTARRIGVSVTTVAYKLSVVIPFVFSIILYHENVSWLNICGIILALAAVYLTCYRSRLSINNFSTQGNKYLIFILPAIVFFGSGLLDTMIKFVEQVYLQPAFYNRYLVTAFFTAASVGIMFFALSIIMEKQKFSYKAVLAGIAIGIPNYFSIWCLLQVLKEYRGKSAAMISVNNMGIVLFSSVVAWLFFKETLTGINWLGIVLSILSIALIAFG